MSKSSMPFNFLIELDSHSKEKTVFNLLPKEWCDKQSALMIAVLIPCSSSNFTYSWINLAQFFQSTPLINYFSVAEIENIQKNPELKITNNVIFANNDDSIELIQNISTQDNNTLVVTQNKNYKNILNECQTILWIEESFNEIFDKIYRWILEIMDGCPTFDQNIIEKNDFKNGFIQNKSFLHNTEITNNLLCTANEIVFAHIRSKIPNYRLYESREVLSLDEAYQKNIDLVYEINSEKTLDLLLSSFNHNLDKQLGIPEELHKLLKLFGTSHNLGHKKLIKNIQ